MTMTNAQLQELLAHAYAELVAQRDQNDLLRVELDETKEQLSDLRYEVYGPDESYVSYFEWKDSCKYLEKQLEAKDKELETLKANSSEARVLEIQCHQLQEEALDYEQQIELLKEEIALAKSEHDYELGKALEDLDDLRDEYENLHQAYDSLLEEQEMMDEIVRQGKEYDAKEIERLNDELEGKTQLLKSQEFIQDDLIEQYGNLLAEKEAAEKDCKVYRDLLEDVVESLVSKHTEGQYEETDGEIELDPDYDDLDEGLNQDPDPNSKVTSLFCYDNLRPSPSDF